MMETLSALVALLLTLSLLSYLIRDNPLYRVAAHLFVGVSAGYAVMLAWHTVIAPHLLVPLRAALAGGDLVAQLPNLALPLASLVLGALLVLKTARVASRAGTLLAVAVMAGVGAAVAVGGAITGTLLPQTNAALVSLVPTGGSAAPLGEVFVEGLFMVVGTVATLGFFYYTARAEPGSPVQRPALVRPLASVGEVFIGIAFGVLYAGALAASVAVFAERMAALLGYVQRLLGGG